MEINEQHTRSQLRTWTSTRSSRASKTRDPNGPRTVFRTEFAISGIQWFSPHSLRCPPIGSHDRFEQISLAFVDMHETMNVGITIDMPACKKSATNVCVGVMFDRER
jgi:hypothetical protein